MKRVLGWIVGLLAAVGAFVGLSWRLSRALARAETAEATGDTRRRVDDARRKVTGKHREENRDARESVDAGGRDHLDNDW